MNEVASLVVRTKMYPYFDVSNYILMCCMVRDDYAFSGPSNHPVHFSHKHPLSSWFSSMLLCFSSVILTNIILGESPLAPFGNHRDVLTATVVWYLINYCPFDAAYKLSKVLPIYLVINILKEVQRTNKVHHGVHYASTLYPQAYFIICAVGILKGAGYYYMRLFERLVRGTWTPNHHELLQPSGTTKTCLIASLLFILNDTESSIQIPHSVFYLLIIIFFITTRLLYVLCHISDPYAKAEKVICNVLFGGIFEKLKKMIIKEKKVDETAAKTPAKPKKE